MLLKKLGGMMMNRLNKKADLEGLIKIISWIAFFVIAIGALYFLIKGFTG